MIKVILFDFWGTIVENGVNPSPVRQAQRILWLSRMPFSQFVVKFEDALMLKKFDSLSDGFLNVCEEFGIPAKQYQIDQLIGLWNTNRLMAKPYEETKAVLEELKKDYKLVLITNTDCFSVEPLLEKFDLKRYFDEIIPSYQVGMLKTTPKMYEIALEAIGAAKEEALMVGDSMETDYLGAQNAGIKAVLIDRRDRRPHDEKIIDLTQLKEYIAKLK